MALPAICAFPPREAALVRSRNLVSIRLLREIGVPYATDYITRFGFDKRLMPQNLTLALGTVQATPLEVASGYAVFANGGFRVQPYFIERIENAQGQGIWEAKPRIACDDCDRAVDLGDLTSKGSNTAEGLQAADSLRGGRGPLPPRPPAPEDSRCFGFLTATPGYSSPEQESSDSSLRAFDAEPTAPAGLADRFDVLAHSQGAADEDVIDA